MVSVTGTFDQAIAKDVENNFKMFWIIILLKLFILFTQRQWNKCLHYISFPEEISPQGVSRLESVQSKIVLSVKYQVDIGKGLIRNCVLLENF